MANSKSFARVWDALTDTPAESAQMKLRSEIMLLIREAVKSWNLSPRAAAAKLRVTQPRLHELLTGKISRFSLDTLIGLASAAGIKLQITAKVRGSAISGKKKANPKIMHMAIQALGSRERAAAWMRNEQQALGYRVPQELLATPEGTHKVEMLLGAIEYGVYT